MARPKFSSLELEPAYTVPEAALYLRIPDATLRSWLVGTTFGRRYAPRRHFQPVIKGVMCDGRTMLSFTNLVEAHVLKAIRKVHSVPLQQVRKAIEYLRGKLQDEHPLATQDFAMFGPELLWNRCGQDPVSLRDLGQAVMRDIVGTYLSRIERDPSGRPIRLFPVSIREDEREGHDQRLILISPYIAFGKPVMSNSGIPIGVLKERWQAGETIEELAEDYGQDRRDVEEVLRISCAA